jgi:DNA-binding beta-propeller fold protein YncE
VIKHLFWMLAAFAGLAHGGTLFLPAYPHALLVFDEAKGQVVDRIELETGTPRAIRASPDRQKIYVTTIDHNGLEVIDVATRKVINRFVLNTSTKQIRFRSGAPDPAGKLFYTVSKEIDKFPDHYEVAKAKYTVIDLAQQKIVRTVDIAPEDQYLNEAGAGLARYPLEVSPDGKYVYQFGKSIVILRADDFKLVDRIELSQPDFPGMEQIRFGSDLDLIGQPGQHITVFNSADPVVHNKVFGFARFDLDTRQVNFNPIGPAPGGMAGLQVTADKKRAYTMVTEGLHGNKRCEFWAFDLATDRITQRAEVPCRARFSFGMSSDGKKLYIYGAGFEIEVYDAATLQHEHTWDLNADITPAGIVVLP